MKALSKCFSMVKLLQPKCVYLKRYDLINIINGKKFLFLGIF